MSSPVEIKARELLVVLNAEKRDPDWEQRMRLFAGNDSRVLRRIPIVRRKVLLQQAFVRDLENFIANLDSINAELD